jgi:hypothetical protein
MRLILFIGISVLLYFNTNAQNIITGQVVDSLTKKPVPFANVFFANTTIGTVTDTSGYFSIRNFPSGKYDLTVSFVGYNTYQKSIAFEESHFIFKISLTQQVTQLSEVVVRADTTGWKRHYNLFKELFIGLTKNAAEVGIANPRDLRFYYDRPEQLLLGFGQKPIVIENRSLGYRIHYELVQFEYFTSARRLGYFGIPRFEELKPKRTAEANRWARERERAYNGSSAHFIKSLKQNALQENGFKVFYFHRVPNSKRPSDAFLNKRITYWREKLGLSNRIYFNSAPSTDDSLSYYLKLRNEPKLVDSVGRALLDTRELFLQGRDDIINYQGMLMVVYSEREEVGYAIGRAPASKQQSIIHFLGKQLKIYDNGYYENVMDVFFEGYLGWSEKISELLPLEYVPPKG